MSCLFCGIVSGEIPARQVYADDHAIAFLDIAPWHVGHTLVIPRRHVDDLVADPDALSEIAPAISATSRLLVERLAADGLNVLSSNGAAAGQEVFHLHFHLLPRFAHRSGLAELFKREPGIDLDRVHRQLVGNPQP
ncbi:MAG: HIT domain-containing protein [Propionibacteriaceae bacterium]|nr:HIT domain-containing protein [Propionibacteriaceae bacterium]